MTRQILAGSLVAAVFSCALVTASPLRAQDLARTPNDAELRIAIAERARVLVDRMARAACLVGVDRHRSAAMDLLGESMATFTRFHQSSAPFHVSIDDAKRRADIAASWQQEDAAWKIVEPVYADVLASGSAVDDAALKLATGTLSKYADQMFAHARQIYGKDAGLSDLSLQVLVDLYGRERMLIERIGANVCQLARGQQVADGQAALETSVASFSAMLQALRSGAPHLGIVPPPSGAVADRLARVAQEWDALSDYLTRAQVTGRVSAAELDRLLAGIDTISGNLDGVSADLSLILWPKES